MRWLAALVVCGLVGVLGCDRATFSVAAAPPAAAVASDALVTDDVVARVFSREVGDQWYGVYIAGKKVGWGRVGFRRTREPEPPGFVGETELMVRTQESAGAGASAEVQMSEIRFYEGQPPHRLTATQEVERTNGELTRERRIEVDGDEMVVREREGDGFAMKRRLPRSRETLHGPIAENRLDPDWLSVGRRQTFPSFDTKLERDETDTVEVVEILEQRIAGVDTRIAVLKTRTRGESGASTVRMARGGVMLELSIGGLVLKLQDSTVAQSDVLGFDIIADAVPVDRDLGDAGSVDRLDIVLGVSDGFEPPRSPRQEVSRRSDGRYDVILTNGPGRPATASEKKEALVATSAVDFGDPDIERLARTITEGADTDRVRVERLVKWVYENLKKELATNLSSASLVEDRRVGDCTEHTLLMLALSRSLGIPAREVSGLVYMGDEVRRFGYHAWVEVALDGHWVQVDPSWGETAANATHITLGYGEDSSWVATLGNVSIELK